MKDSPHRRYMLIVKIEADTKEAMIHAIRAALFEIESELPERDYKDSVTGGIDCSTIVMYNEDRNINHESYWESVNAYMGERNLERAKTED